jgi:rod shape determining protein RodA
MNLSHLKKIDFPLLFIVAAIVLAGLTVLFSLGVAGNNLTIFYKQLVFLILGIVLAVFLSIMDFRSLKESSWFVFTMYVFGFLLLVGLFLFGVRIRGVRAWYSFGGGNTFEPVELVKIIFILFFAKYFSSRHVEMYHKQHIILSAVYALVPAGLVFIQPDFGSAAILITVWLGMMLVSGIKRRHLFFILGIGLISALIFWNFFLSIEQKERISTFIEPYVNPQGQYLDPSGSSYHIVQSTIAVGSGGILGKGFSNPHTQAKLGFLPEAETDFIFASFCEMFGIVGVIILFALFFFLLWRLFTIARMCKDNFSRLVISGFMILIGTGALVNIAMNVGLLPITGIPLPFLSYGGTSLVSLFIGIGIIESIRSHNC